MACEHLEGLSLVPASKSGACPGLARDSVENGVYQALLLSCSWEGRGPWSQGCTQRVSNPPSPLLSPHSSPHNHVFSYFHQQPNYWSFKVSACASASVTSACALLPWALPAHALPRGVHLHGTFRWGRRALGLQAVAAALRESELACQGFVGSRVGVRAIPAGDLGWEYLVRLSHTAGGGCIWE